MKWVGLIILMLLGTLGFSQKISPILQLSHSSQIKHIDFSPDNKYFLTCADNDNAIYVWEVASGRKVNTIWYTSNEKLVDFTFADQPNEILIVFNNGELSYINYLTNEISVSNKIDITDVQILERDSKGTLYFFSDNGKIIRLKANGEINTIIVTPDHSSFSRILKAEVDEINSILTVEYKLMFSFEDRHKDIFQGQITEEDFKLGSKIIDRNISLSNNAYLQLESSDTLFPKSGFLNYSYKPSNKKVRIKTLSRIGSMKEFDKIITTQNYVIAIKKNGLIYFYNKEGKYKKSLKYNQSEITEAAVDKLGEKLVVGTANGSFILVDLKTLQVNNKYSNYTSSGVFIAFFYNPDGTKLFQLRNNTLTTYDFTLNTIFVSSLFKEDKKVNFISFALEGDSVFTYNYSDYESGSGAVEIIEARLNLVKNTLIEKSKGYNVDRVTFLYPNGCSVSSQNYVINYMPAIHRITVSKGNNSFKFEPIEHKSKISFIAINENYNYFSTVDLDGVIKHWDLRDGHLIYSSIIINANNYIHYLSSGYYLGGKNLKNLLSFTNKGNIIPEYIGEILLNQPSVIADSIRQLNPIYKSALISADKKIKKSQLTLGNPEVSLNILEYKKAGDEKLEMNLKVISAVAPLKEIGILINGVKIGTSLNLNDGKEYSGKITLDLNSGENLIEIFALASNGDYSNVSTIKVTNEKKYKPNLYLFCVGSDEFKEETFNLRYPAKDAKDVLGIFSSINSFNTKNAKIFSGKEVNKSLIDSLNSFIKNAKYNDFIVLYFAGHGVLDNNFDYYLSTYDLDFNDPAKKGIPLTAIENELSKSVCRNKLLFLDACNSGGIDKEIISLNSESVVSNKNVKFRNGVAGVRQDELMLTIYRELFSSSGNSEGLYAIGASKGSQLAMESDLWNNGAFTFALKSGLGKNEADYNKDRQISFLEIQYYLEHKVAEITNGSQQPTTRSQNVQNNFRVK